MVISANMAAAALLVVAHWLMGPITNIIKYIVDLFTSDIVTDNKSVTAAPEFLKPIQDVELMEKMSVTFRCKLQGYPQPRVLWYKDGKVLRNNEHVRIRKSGDICILTICKLRYSCT